MAKRKDSVPMSKLDGTRDCPLQVEMRPVLTDEVFAFPDALAEVTCLRCASCGHWICLDYRIELDDNPELDLNPD